MAEEKGGGLEIMLGLGKKKPGMGDDAEMDASAKTDAAQAVIDAVKSGDAAALSDALSTHYDLCHSSASEDDGGDYEEA